MSKARDEFLNNHWQKYPECPRGFLQYGRVHQLRLGTHNVSEFKFRDNLQYKASDVLIDGDLIALMPAGVLVLLTPNLTKRSGFYKSEDHPWIKKKSYFEYLYFMRQFFNEKRFLEVKTSTLVDCPGTEPSLEVFETLYECGSEKRSFFLPTSPEIHLKKLLSMGAERIFEIAPVFRNGEKTERHHYEFLMLEWYRSMAHLSSIKHDAIELIEFLADKLKVERPKEVLTYSVKELFKKYCDFDFTPETTSEELQALAIRLNIDVKSATCIDDYFYLIFMDKIEYKWPKDRLVFVEKYPPYQAALARIDKDGWAERFEIYWNGLELANAFHELNDPFLQKQRSLEDLEKKKLMGKKNVTLDDNFFQSLEYGMPPSAGIALGVERLYMALKNVNSIDSLVEYTI
ncbi:MAG: EF-P lysine aminoacylase EpmA [Pseudobdellovibrio sp.]